jgi:hypothetical protein
MATVTSALVYSSEYGEWSETTSVHHHLDERRVCIDMMPSVLVGDALTSAAGGTTSSSTS